MIAVAHWTFAENQFTQAPLAFFQRNRSGIETIEAEQIEDVIADRNREAQPRYLARVIHMHPALQQLKTRTAGIVLRDDFAIENKALVRQRVQGEHDLRIARGDVGAAPRIKMRCCAVANRQCTHAVVLEF